MTTLVVIFGALISLVGAIGVVSPETLMGIVTSAWRSPRGVYIAVGMRLVLGIILVIAAPGCRFPDAILVIGIISIVAAILIPLVGYERLTAVVDWWVARPSGFLRGWAVVALAFGGFLIYAGI